VLAHGLRHYLTVSQQMSVPASKPRDHQIRWSISLIKATAAKYFGQVFATTKEAVKEFNVAENLRDRIVARKEDY